MVAPVVDEKTIPVTLAADSYRHSNLSRWASINPFEVALTTTTGSPQFRVRDPGGTWTAWRSDSLSVAGNLVAEVAVPAVFGVTAGEVYESDAVALSSQGHQLQLRVTASPTAGATREVHWTAGGQSGVWGVRTTGATANQWTGAMTRNIYNWHVTARAGTPVADTNTRFWSERPTIPEGGEVYASISELNAALAAEPSPQTGTFKLADGAYDGTITIPSGCANITVCAETVGGVNLIGGSRAVINGTNVDFLGFSFDDQVRPLSSGFNPVALAGTDNRIALCTFRRLTLDKSVGTATSVTRAASPIVGGANDGDYIVTVNISNTNLAAGGGVPGQNNARFITLSGATQPEYNGTHLIRTRTPSAITFYIEPSPLPATPATGTILVNYEFSWQFPQLHYIVYGSGTRCRVCYCEFDTHVNEGNWIRNIGEHRYSRWDHNLFLNKRGLPSDFGYTGSINVSGVREELQIGQNDTGEDYYALVDNNWTERFNFDATKAISDPRYGTSDLELWSLKSSSNCFLHNCIYQSCGRINHRTAQRSTIYGNYFIGDGSGFVNGQYVRGQDTWVLFNIWMQCNVIDDWSPLYIHGGTGVTGGLYPPADDVVIANNTIYQSPFSLLIRNNYTLPIVPGEIRSNAFQRTGSESVIKFYDAAANLTSWTIENNVGANSQAQAGFVNAQPALTLSNSIPIPTAAGNCDGTGTLPSIIDVDECVDILGTDLSGLSTFHVGAVQPGYTLSGNPWLAIYDEAGPG